MTKHSALCASLRDAFLSKDYQVLNIHGNHIQASGWPDLLAVGQFGAFFIEVKIEDDTLSKLQRIIMRQLSPHAICVVIHKDINGKIVAKTVDDEVIYELPKIRPFQGLDSQLSIAYAQRIIPND